MVAELVGTIPPTCIDIVAAGSERALLRNVGVAVDHALDRIVFCRGFGGGMLGIVVFVFGQLLQQGGQLNKRTAEVLRRVQKFLEDRPLGCGQKFENLTGAEVIHRSAPCVPSAFLDKLVGQLSRGLVQPERNPGMGPDTLHGGQEGYILVVEMHYPSSPRQLHMQPIESLDNQSITEGSQLIILLSNVVLVEAVSVPRKNTVIFFEHFVVRSEERRVGKECRSRWS